MADKGWISKITLQGIVDEVRRLTDTTDGVTPAAALALLQGVAAGTIRMGTITPATSGLKSFGIASPIPDGDFVVMITSGGAIPASTPGLRSGYMSNIDGVSSACVLYVSDNAQQSSNTASWTYNRASGEITLPGGTSCGLRMGSEYIWIFAGGEID